MKASFYTPTRPLGADRNKSHWQPAASPDAALDETRTGLPARNQERRLMRSYFGVMAIGLVFAALCGAALSWDGSGYLFETLDKQVPFVPNGRLITVPLLLPVLLVSHVTANPDVLQAIFGVTYAAIPLGALAASWWVVRDGARSLFVWAALAIGLGMLPGQFFFVAEANIALQLFWPILLALLTGGRKTHVPLVVALSVAVLFSHPYAIGLFALAAVVALAVGLRHRGAYRRMRWWALGFGALAVLALVAFLRSSYDTQQVSSGGLVWSLDVSTIGPPLVALVCALVVATAVFAAPFAAWRGKDRLTLVLRVVEGAGIVAVAVVLALWARDPHLWQWANKFTYPALFASLCFMALAVFEGLVYASDAPHDVNHAVELDWRHRTRTIQAAALVFSLVLCIQGAAWFTLTDRLRETIAQSPWGCVSMAPLGWLQHTPLNQFDTPDQSLLLQGRVPQKVVLNGNGCGDATFSTGVSLNQYSVRQWDKGWFDLRPLGQRLVAERNVPTGCTFTLSTGWYTTETDGPYWWRWSDGRDARMRVLLNRPTTVVVNGQIQSERTSNRVDVLVNGRTLTTLSITGQGPQSLRPLSLALKRGANTIQFVSHNPATIINGRALAIELANVTAVSTDNALSCGLHP